MTRKIVKIDPDKCNGCGLCVSACAEGAIQLVDGKARLVSESYCDGLGACLGECPQGAITIEERPADAFDPIATEEHLRAQGAAANHAAGHGHGACPGMSMRQMQRPAPRAAGAAEQGTRPSQLAQWPVQLALISPQAPYFQDADLLIAADCTAFALADFHERLLAGRSVAIACPKLDEGGGYVEKLAAIFAGNRIKSVTVAHMEVPCCTGIVRMVQAALAQAGCNLPLRDVTVTIDGRLVESK